MPQIENKELLGLLLRSTIGVISRRTSEAYANVIIGNVIENLSKKYDFLKYIKIQGVQFTEVYDIVEINNDINIVKLSEIGKASNEFIKKITDSIGRDAGYYFIKEIREDLPYDYEKTIREVGVDLDFLQMEFITNVKENLKFSIQNYEIIKYIITLLYEILERENGREFAYKTLNELITRLTTRYEVLKFIKINDVRSIQGVDIATVSQDVNEIGSKYIGAAIQKIIQEINDSLDQKGGFDFIEKIKDFLNADYNFKLLEMGVNFDVIKLNQVLVVKHVLKALVDVLSDSSTESYAVLMVNNSLRKFEFKFTYLKYIEIDGLHISEGVDAINVPEVLDSVSASDLGRGLQKVIENISISMGEEAGTFFIEKFKRRLGKAYVLRIEEIGVNLHMIELRQNMMW
jgi:hypothetical protein